MVCDMSEKSGKNFDGFKLLFWVYNLGNIKLVTVSDFVSSFEKAFGKIVKRNYVLMLKIGDVLFMYVDILVVK